MFSPLSRVSHTTAIIGLRDIPQVSGGRAESSLSRSLYEADVYSLTINAGFCQALPISFVTLLHCNPTSSGSQGETLQWVASSSGEEVDTTCGGRTISSGSLLPSSTRSAMLPIIHRCIPLRPCVAIASKSYPLPGGEPVPSPA
jgi:hypothetical protein